MRKFGAKGLVLGIGGLVGAAGSADAAETSATPLRRMPVNCQAPDAPYKSYDCLDAYLGDGFFERLVNYYRLEWGHDGPPADPKAPSSRRAGWPDAPQISPPMPFTEWPYGGTTNLGVTRPAAVDSPLMVALANTGLGKAMSEASIQAYGWVNVGGNLSTNTVKPGGNWPISYDYTPNTVQLDQAVVYVERLPDTVQKDHVDWGFRFSAIYGENYRYTTAFGIASYQLLGHNLYNGYDFPMVYGEIFIPQIAEGLIVRLGRYISIPDIEAQLAPNNYMYSHSMTYTFDNYTNNGIMSTLALDKNWILQLGLSAGTEAAAWNMGAQVPNPFPNPVYPGNTMPKDPGAVPSVTVGVRWASDSGHDNVYVVANAINSGAWGYNNLQWYGVTWFHNFNDKWHLAFETYTLSQKNVLNASDPAGIIARGGFPFAPANGFNFNAPSFAQCSNPNVLTCTASVYTALAYLNYKFSPMDNLSFRAEYYDDMEGQRTGTKTRYVEFGVGWQHWFSPQIELRPEVSYYRSLDANAFNGNSNAVPASAGGAPQIATTRNYSLVAGMDLIWHF
jgi:hypothetical protein